MSYPCKIHWQQLHMTLCAHVHMFTPSCRDTQHDYMTKNVAPAGDW